MKASYYMRSGGRYNAVRKARRHRNLAKTREESRVGNWKRKGLVAPYPEPKQCESCGRGGERLCLDHCHLTGLFRGWICHKCNTALGLLEDSPEGVSRLLRYITVAYGDLHKRISK